MKKHEDIDIDQVLSAYLATCSPEQLIAELETPSRKALMTIPDENFFCTADNAILSPIVLEACGIDEAFNLLGNLSFDSLEDLSWTIPVGVLHNVSSLCPIASAANTELALAA